ncbi:uncharacterized protein BT62DRAFT_1000130 [Guyanagaster necrorhizus]|uniref:Uncharacterized protein n=1 Tax=Guyanagaster necrorhizus TaxID=856835 RepID=A0A9P7W4P6_9AGAR|nr:uncharacterized protein BT62DRAFT_1000130 [Guyanagaster necrorhizus MCA 3950]KAG7452395.1 hypothetical protein BT62DRAFT_1000130 [Guyanagaster necrorhizus MCA 3950]
MSTRRRIGVSNATTEAARRQLMQPVPCWEKAWVTPEGQSVNSTLKVFKWVKTDKIQQFNEDDHDADEPLAPLPDEPEVVDGDDEVEQDEQDDKPITVDAEATHNGSEVPEAVTQSQSTEPPTKPPSPDPQLSLEPPMTDDLTMDDTADVLEASLKPLDSSLEDVDKMTVEHDGMELDMSSFGPDGLGLEGSHDLTQLEPSDTLMGGPLMDDTVDPFAAAEPMGEQ